MYVQLPTSSYMVLAQAHVCHVHACTQYSHILVNVVIRLEKGSDHLMEVILKYSHLLIAAKHTWPMSDRIIEVRLYQIQNKLTFM